MRPACACCEGEMTAFVWQQRCCTLAARDVKESCGRASDAGGGELGPSDPSKFLRFELFHTQSCDRVSTAKL